MKKYVNGVEVRNDLSEEALEKLLNKIPEKWAAFQALSNKNTPSSLEILKRYALSQDKYERIAAIQALSNHALGAHAAEIIHKNLQNKDPLILVTACRAVGQLRLKQFHEEIHSLLKSKSVDIRKSAMYSISGIWTPTDFDAICMIYQKDERCHKDAAYVLYSIVDSHNWQLIFNLFANDKHVPRHRVWACQIASQYAGKDIIGAINVLNNDSDGHVRRAAERTLLKLTQKQF